MTTPGGTDRERAEEEAAAWLVHLSEAPGDQALHARFEAWRAGSALNGAIWEQTSRAYGLIGRTAPRHHDHWAAHAAQHRPRRKLPMADRPSSRRPRAIPKPIRLVVAAAIAATLAIALLPDLILRAQADAMTRTGETRRLTLADGSQVNLAPNSAIGVDLSGPERQIHLLKGEAYFEVTPDPARPFSVAAGTTTARVLGTAFDVRRGEDAVIVAVQHGRVGVSGTNAASGVENLLAGDWVQVGGAGEVVRGKMPPDDIAGWRHGMMIARDRPISDVVDALRRYHKGLILVQDDAFASKHVSGIYDLRTPEETLGGLTASHGAVLRRVSPWLLVVTKS